MDRVQTLTDQVRDKVRDWYENSPTAQKAYAKLRADVATVAERAGPTATAFWDRIAPIIDPPAKTPDAERKN